MAVVEISRHGEFAALRRAKKSAAALASVEIGIYGGIVALHLSIGGDDVKHTAHTLGIVFCARVGNDFNFLDYVGRHAAEHLFRVVGHHGVGLSVNEHLEAARAIHLNVVLAVDRHHRHFAQHLGDGVGFSVGVGFHVVGDFVHVGFNERARCLHNQFGEGIVGSFCKHFAQVDALVCGI